MIYLTRTDYFSTQNFTETFFSSDRHHMLGHQIPAFGPPVLAPLPCLLDHQPDPLQVRRARQRRGQHDDDRQQREQRLRVGRFGREVRGRHGKPRAEGVESASDDRKSERQLDRDVLGVG